MELRRPLAAMGGDSQQNLPNDNNTIQWLGVASIQDREKSIIPNKNPLGGFLEHLMFNEKFLKNCDFL